MENKESNEVRKEKINKTTAKYEKKYEVPIRKTGIEQLEQMKARKNRGDIFRPKFDNYDEDDSRENSGNEKKVVAKNQSLRNKDNIKSNGKKIDREVSNKKRNRDTLEGNHSKEHKNIKKEHKNKDENRDNRRQNINSKRDKETEKGKGKERNRQDININKVNEKDRKRQEINNKKNNEKGKKEQEINKRKYQNNVDKKQNLNIDAEKNNVTDISEVERLRKEREKRNKIIKRQERKEAIAERLREVNYKRVVVIASIAVVIIILSTVMSFTMIKTTIIDEGANYTKDEIKEMVMDSMLDHNSIYLFLKYRYSEQKKIPFIEYIDVSWVDKNTVKIKVYDKKIIGCTSYMNQFIYFDKDGLVVETSNKRQNTIPYITGLNFEEVKLYKKIKVKDEEIFDVILAVTQQISKYKLDIGEINFDKNYNMTLYSGDITILLGKKEAYDEQLAKLQNMLKEAKKKNLKGTLHMENYVEGQNRIIFNKNN